MSTKKNTKEQRGTALKERTQKPRKYKVILHNDDFTTVDFVMFVLKTFFKKNETEAYQLTMQVHHQGYAVPGVFTLEVAEMKVQQVIQSARNQGHPFLATHEPE